MLKPLLVMPAFWLMVVVASADGGAKVVVYSWGGMKTASEQRSCLEGCSFLLLLKRCIMHICLKLVAAVMPLKTFVSFH